MKKLTILAIVSVALASCSKEDYLYNHCYTFDKTKFGVASSSFFQDHELSKQEQEKWCREMDRKVIETLNKNPNNHYELSDIDTSYVYLVAHKGKSVNTNQ